MNIRTFKTTSNLDLIVKSTKSAVIFEMSKSQENKDYKFSFNFTPKSFKELITYIETVSKKIWGNLKPKEAQSLGADYYEYYDRKLDCNGYLSIGKNSLYIERPSLDSEKLYQFNKGRMESFIYDLKNNFII